MARLMGCALILSLFAPAVVHAGPPDAANSHVPLHLNLVGTHTQAGFAVPDPMGIFQVTVRDADALPVQNTNVYVYLNACGQTIPSKLQFSLPSDPCDSDPIVAETDNNGVAQFNILGSTLHRQAAQPVPCASVFADGPASFIHLGDMSVAAFDEDGLMGVRGTDLRYFLCDQFMNPLNSSRSDFNGVSGTNSADLALWVQEYFSYYSSERTAPRCDLVNTGTAALTAGQLYLSASNGGKGSCLGSGGSATVTPDCAGSALTRITVSLKPTATISNPVAFEAVLELVGPAGLPFEDFWRLDVGDCNIGALTPRGTMSTSTGPLGCPFALQCTFSTYVIASVIEYPYPGTNDIDRARIRVVGTPTPPWCATSLAPNTQYTLFALDLDPSIAAGGCSGCNTSMAVKLVSVMINQSTGPWDCSLPAAPTASLERVASTLDDILITSSTSDDSTVVFFNGVPAGYQVTGVGGHPTASSGTWLAPVQPNPCVSSARARYRLPRAQQVSLAVFDLSGRRIQEPDSGLREAGEHSATWDGHDHSGALAPGGIYFLRLRTPEGSFSRTVITRR